MKKYLVIKQYKNIGFNPDVEGQFDTYEEADQFAKLLTIAKGNKNLAFWVYEMSK